MGIKELRQAKADNDAAQAALKAEGRKLTGIAADKRTPEQHARLDAIDAELDAKANEAQAIAADLRRAERFAEEEKATSRAHESVASSGVRTKGFWEASDEPETEAPAATATIYRGLPRMAGAAGLKYALGSMLQDVFAASAQHRTSDNLLKLQAAAQGAGEKIGSDGGFAVQTDIVQGLISNIFTGGALLNAVRQINLSSNANGVSLMAVDETSRATGSRWGGVQGYWVDEGTAATKSKPTYRKLELKLNKVAALGYATDELLADAGALGDVMYQAFSEELRFLVENAIINGTGAGQPLGILNAAAKVTVTRGTASHVTAVDIGKMWARMPTRSKGSAIWLVNTDVNPDLDSLYLTGTNSDFQPRFVTYGATGLMQIKGRPVVETEYNATLGTSGDFVLFDPTQYLFIQKLLETASSMHVAFTTDEQAFRVTWRVDGRPAWISALTPFKGSNTQSPYIVLN